MDVERLFGWAVGSAQWYRYDTIWYGSIATMSTCRLVDHLMTRRIVFTPHRIFFVGTKLDFNSGGGFVSK